MARDPMALLLTTGDEFYAQLVAAQLGSEGIIAHVRGRDIYHLGSISVFVEARALAKANEVLAAVPIPSSDELVIDPAVPFEEPPRGLSPGAGRARRRRLAMIVSAAILVGFVLQILNGVRMFWSGG